MLELKGSTNPRIRFTNLLVPHSDSRSVAANLVDAHATDLLDPFKDGLDYLLYFLAVPIPFVGLLCDSNHFGHCIYALGFRSDGPGAGESLWVGRVANTGAYFGI